MARPGKHYRRERAGRAPTRLELSAYLNDLRGRVVQVGLNEGGRVLKDARGAPGPAGDVPKTIRDEDGQETASEELTLVQVATFNEFGMGVPARPAFAIAAREGKALLGTLARRVWQSIARGDRPLSDLPELLGQKHVAQIQATIAEGVPPPNAPETIRRKGSSRTLINTGQYRQSITYVVTPKGDV